MPEFTADRDDLIRAVKENPEKVLKWIENNHDQGVLDALQGQVDPRVVEDDVPPDLRARLLSSAMEKLKRAGYSHSSEYGFYMEERDQARVEAQEQP